MKITILLAILLPASAFGMAGLSLDLPYDIPSPTEFVRENGECRVAHFPEGKIPGGVVHYDASGAPVAYLPEASLEAKYCERMYPPNAEKALDQEYDLPAELLHVSSDSLKSDSEKTIRNTLIVRSYEKRVRRHHPEFRFGVLSDNIPSVKVDARNVDWDAIIAFNIEAAKLWEAALECGSDATAIRQAYRNGRGFCAGKESDQALATRIMSTRENLRSFLTSAYLPDFKGALILPRFHPLFTQMLMEELAIMLRFPYVDKDASHFITKQQYEFLRKRGYSGKYYREVPAWRIGDEFSHEYRFIRSLANTLSLLTIIPDENCANWGLWPGASRSLVYAVDHIWNDFIKDDMAIITAKINYACGDMYEEGTSVYERYGVHNSRAFVNQFRKFAAQWSSKDREWPIKL